MSAPAIEVVDVTKRFPGVVANSHVSFSVARGSVHALVGENGAGKSTLMKTLYGMHRPDEGTVRVDGVDVSFRSPSDAIAAGIGMVHQHVKLAENLTVLENIVAGAERTRRGMIDVRGARRAITELGRSHGLPVDPDARVDELGIGMRQRVEILKALYRGAEVLILDEPSAVLVPQEVEDLFVALEELKRNGLTILFISHKLDEVLALADDITVIRRGTTVTTMPAAGASPSSLATLMVGHELPTPPPRRAPRDTPTVLELAGVTLQDGTGRTALDDVSLTVRAGEILGIAGVEGNGQSELIECVMGIRQPSSGQLLLDGTDITRASTRRRREMGMAYVPEDRTRDGLLLEAQLWENRMLGHQTEPRFRRGPVLDRRLARADTERIVAEHDVRTPSVSVRAGSLSGGNQQKLIIGREMAGRPRLLVAAHPTRGVDVGAQAGIWDVVKSAADDGLAVLLVSADLEELIGLSDRLVVVLRGRLTAELDPGDVTAADLGAAMTGAWTIHGPEVAE